MVSFSRFSTLRRLARDHAALRCALPPNYLFPLDDDAESIPDDLTQLLVYVTGSEGTPYSTGLWLLHLRIPSDYPKSPPKATFRTRIFHPNVDELTGAVCLETLKRDWDPKLTLKDILITISCLLIQPNPDSALNEKAGVLVREDYEGFVRQARLMTKIHASILPKFVEAADEARRRGEDEPLHASKGQFHKNAKSIPTNTASFQLSRTESTDSAKENIPSATRVQPTDSMTDSKKPVLGKRPLIEASLAADVQEHNQNATVLSIAQTSSQIEGGERPRKSPKHTHQSQPATAQAPSDMPDNDREAQVVLKMPERGSFTAPELSIPPRLEQRSSKAGSKYRIYARKGIKRL